MAKDKARLGRKDKQEARVESKKIVNHSKKLKADISGDRYRSAAGQLSEIEALTRTLDPKVVDLSRLQDRKRELLKKQTEARVMNRQTHMAKKGDKKVERAARKNVRYQKKLAKRQAAASFKPDLSGVGTGFGGLTPWKSREDNETQ